MFLEDLERGLVLQSLMWALGVVVHLPQTVLVAPLFGIFESHLRKAFLVVRAVAPFDDTIAPGTAFGDQRVRAPLFFDGFGEGGFALGMGTVAQGEVAGVVGEDDKKGGRLSKARA